MDYTNIPLAAGEIDKFYKRKIYSSELRAVGKVANWHLLKQSFFEVNSKQTASVYII